MPTTMSKVKRAFRSSSPSACFQEALRLCRHEEKEEEWWTEEEIESEGGRQISDNSTDRTDDAGVLCTSSGKNDLIESPHDDPIICSPQGRSSQTEQLPTFASQHASSGTPKLPSRRRMSLPLLRQSDSRELLRVQWADERQQELVREHPRKKYERKPSLQLSELPKPILKRSSSTSAVHCDKKCDSFGS